MRKDVAEFKEVCRKTTEMFKMFKNSCLVLRHLKVEILHFKNRRLTKVITEVPEIIQAIDKLNTQS